MDDSLLHRELTDSIIGVFYDVYYLRATEIEVGLIMNFGSKPEFKRRVFENARKVISDPDARGRVVGCWRAACVFRLLLHHERNPAFCGIAGAVVFSKWFGSL